MGRGKHVKPRPSGAQHRKKKATYTAFTKKIAGSMLKYVVTNSITRADDGGDDSSASTPNAPTMHQQLRSYSENDEHGDTPRSRNSRPAPAKTDSNHHLAGSIEIIALQKSRFEITLSMKYFFMWKCVICVM